MRKTICALCPCVFRRERLPRFYGISIIEIKICGCLKGCCLARSTARLSCRRRVRIHSVNPIYQPLIVTYSANVLPHSPQGGLCWQSCPSRQDFIGLARSADVTLIAPGFPVCPSFVQYVKVLFCEQVGNRTPAAMGIGTKLRPSIFLSVCRACTPGDNSYICRT